MARWEWQGALLRVGTGRFAGWLWLGGFGEDLDRLFFGKGWPKEGKEEEKWGRVSISFRVWDGSGITDFYTAAAKRNWNAAEMR